MYLFFFKQKTAYEMRISDWSSDLCSSDLLDYRILPVNIGAGDQFKPDFLKIAPNNRMPAIVDHDPADGGASVSVFESGAILVYLANRTGRFFGDTPREKIDTMQWLMWQMRSEEHTSELPSLMRISYDVFCLTKKK